MSDRDDLDEAVRIGRVLPLVLGAVLAALVGLAALVRVEVLESLPIVGLDGGQVVVALTDRLPESFAAGGAVRVATGSGTWQEGRLAPAANPRQAVVLVTGWRPGAGPVQVVAVLPPRPILFEVLTTVGEGL